ncbi:MAG: hypothetical protein A2W17_00995 [Planctomycetes bacterium RBG_16_41_13]|nr:MAG: hypothetical protein A2W17_00995 [Planctomycetes bacterium RBG_16_41_13]
MGGQDDTTLTGFRTLSGLTLQQRLIKTWHKLQKIRNAPAVVLVEDLSEIGVRDDIEVIHSLLSALDSVNDIDNQARDKRIAVFLDYDETLTP